VPDRWVLGVDIGGTNLVVGVVPAAGGAPLAQESRPTGSARGADAAVADIGEMADAVVAKAVSRHGGQQDRVVGVGIGCPGPLDLVAGTILRTPNLGWAGYPIRQRIAERLGLPAGHQNPPNGGA
jgi:glucokinase